jgi:hypothetical protein
LAPESAGDPDGVETGTSLFLIAVGAILYFAVTAHIAGISIATVGLILMIVGIIGLVLSLFFMSRRRSTVVEERPVSRREYY